ncbi:MAG: TonB-dependent receptor [Flavisolibacter sp.]
MKGKVIGLILWIFISLTSKGQFSGAIHGKIISQLTKQPLVGVTVMVKGTNRTGVTDTLGMFEIESVPEGTYSVAASIIGYQEKIVNDVLVVRDKIYFAEWEMIEATSSLGAVSVKAYRNENNPRLPVSTYSFSREEIFRNPGAQGDIFRAIGILPGVTSGGAQYSAISVRGQGTADNVYMVDDMPMFELSHLEIEGFNAGFNDPNGGRFSIFAPRVVDNALFQSGGFPAQYGRKSSSFLSLGIKEGNKFSSSWSGQFDLLGFTLIYDGPSHVFKNTSLFATARYQNFSLLEKVVDLKGAGLPSYGDYMIKITTELNKKNKLSFIGMYNPEHYVRTIGDIRDAGNISKDNSSNFDGESTTDKAIFGLNLRTLTGTNSVWKNIAYYRLSDVDNFLGYAYPVVDANGNLADKNYIPADRNLRHIKNDQQEAGYRSIFTVHTSSVTFTGGIDLARVHLDYSRRLEHADTLYTFYPGDLRPDTTEKFLILQPSDFNSRFDDVGYNVSAYADLSFSLFRGFILNPGVRFDYTSFTDQRVVSPRLTGSVLLNEKQSINFAAGIYYQDPSYIDLAGQAPGHKLKEERTIQYILGYKNYFSPDLKLVVEGWYKDLNDLATRPLTGKSFLTNNGTGYAYGGDINLTKRLSDRYYGQVGYSYGVSKRNDHDGLGNYDFTFSQPNIISLLASYEPNERWILSTKFRYSTGRPFDKYIIYQNVFNNQQFLRYSEEIVEKNASRVTDFISWDIRADYRVQKNKIAWTGFIDIVDVLNRFNENSTLLQPLTGTFYRIGLGIFPTFGIRIEL